MIYRYIRFSSDKQDEQSQSAIIDRYCKAKGIQYEETIRDEAVSGKEGSYKNRNLMGLFNRLEAGDTLVISELSRLSRGGIVELGNIVSEFLKPRKIRLVICNYSLDIDCCNISPMTELQLSIMATFAKIERDSLIERTNAALDARRKMVETDGGWVSKSGNWCTHLGREKGCDTSAAVEAASLARTNARLQWYIESEAFQHVKQQIMDGRSNAEILADMAAKYERNPELWCTRGGACLSKGVLSKWRRLVESGLGSGK